MWLVCIWLVFVVRVFGCVECDVYSGVLYAYIFWILELWLLWGVR